MGAKASEPQTKLPVFLGVQPYAREDARGRPAHVSAIHEDKDKIDATADRLQQAGFGVLRERNARAGRVYYRLNATWVGPGEPPEHPLG